MVFQKMSKNYSLIEIKSLLQTIQDQIFSILLDSSSNSNSHYFQNFTGISLKTIKYLNHYLNVLNHDEKIGSSLNYIYQNLQRSFTEYKSTNIYAQSCLSSPLAFDEDEEKAQDQICHFMNTRNKNIPLQCLDNPDKERERMELAMFVENMSKKKVTLKQPKRSLQLPQEHQAGLKILRKATFDPSFHLAVEQDPLNNQSPVQLDKIKDNEQVEVQTQTDCVFHQYETQTQRQEDECKSQAQSCLKSEIAVATIENLENSVIKKNKANMKNKKNIKGNDIKGSQKKKKAQIATSTKQNEVAVSVETSLKNSRKESKNQIASEKRLSLKKQCSIKVLCSQKETIQLGSKEANIVYTKDYFKIIQNQASKQSSPEQIENSQSQTYRTSDSKIKGLAQVAGKKTMEVIAQTMEEYIHPELKSDPSCKSEMLTDQVALIISQGDENQNFRNLSKKLNLAINRNSVSPSKIIPIASVSYDQHNPIIQKDNQGNQKSSSSKSALHKTRNMNNKQAQFLSNKNQNEKKQNLNVNTEQRSGKLKQKNHKEQQIQTQHSQYGKTLQMDGNMSNSNNKQKIIDQKQLQHMEDSHLAPIRQPSHIQRFSKLNVRKSKMEYISRRLKNKFVHSTDYLDKYVSKQDYRNKKQLDNSQKQFQSRNSSKKGSLIIINNRNKIIEEKTDPHKREEAMTHKQPNQVHKNKVKLANLCKLGYVQTSQKQNVNNLNNKLIKSMQKDSLNMSCDAAIQNLKDSAVKLPTEEKEDRPYRNILRNKKIAQSCYIVNSQSQYNLIAKQLRQKNKRELIRQYLDLIQASHKKFCGQKCAHIQNLYKKVNFDGTKSEQDIIEQLLRLIKKGK